MIKYRDLTSIPAVLGFYALFAAMAILPGCTTGLSQADLLATHRQWPDPPGEPRIRWIKEIRSYRDTGIGNGFWRRMIELVTGRVEPGIQRPYGVLTDRDGRLFIVDTGGGIVHLMDGKEGRYTAIGSGSEISFTSPIAICEDDNGFAYITDSAAGQIFRYSLRNGSLTPFTRVPIVRPTGIAWNSRTGNVLVTDTAAHQVIAFDTEGGEKFRIGSHGNGDGQFHYPTDLFVDRKGRVFITDALNARIQIFSPEGAFLRSFGQAGDTTGNFAKPKGVAVDSDGHIYVCDALFDAVQVFDEQGQLLLVFGSRGSGNGELWMPAGIHIDDNDTIYVADAFNRRVQVFQYLKAQRGSKP